MATHEVYRDGKVHVLEDRCATCIFRSPDDGQIRGLAPGRISGMVRDARSNYGGNIPCHSTIYDPEVKPAICRGFWDLPERPALLEIAERLGYIEFDPVPVKA